MRLPGIRFEAITMAVEPTAAKFKGQTIPGIRFAITDRQAYRPVRTSLLLIDEIRRQHPREFAWSTTIDRLTGSDKVRLAIEGGRLPRAARRVGSRGRGVSSRAASRSCSIPEIPSASRVYSCARATSASSIVWVITLAALYAFQEYFS